MNEHRYVSYLHALMLAVIGGLAFHQADAQEANSGATKLPTRGTVEVQQCVVRFADEVDVPSTETGVVAEVHVKQNDLIRRGAPLARLDDRTLLANRNAAEVRLKAAESLAESDVELLFARTALSEARAELKLNEDIQSEMAGSIARQRLTKAAFDCRTRRVGSCARPTTQVKSSNGRQTSKDRGNSSGRSAPPLARRQPDLWSRFNG